MAEPTLSDITNIRGDANIAGGTAGIGGNAPATQPVQFDQGLDFLNQAADAREAYNKYLTEQYQKNLSEGLANLQNIDISKGLSSDLPGLRQKYADYAKNVSDNFDVVRNPGLNPAKAAELAQQEADLRGDIATSTNHNAINTYNKNFIAQNPTFNTPQNQALVSNFENTPMDQRKDFLLQPNSDVDYGAVAKVANQVAKQTTSNQSLSKDGKFINQQDATTIDPAKYDQAFLSTMKNTYQNGVSLYDKYKNNYDLMPASMKTDANGNPITPDQYIVGIGQSLRDQNSTSTGMKDNAYGIQGQSEAFQASQSAKQRAFQADQNALDRANQAKLLKKGELDPLEAGEAKLRTLASTFTSGDLVESQGQSIYGDNTKITKQVSTNEIDPTTHAMVKSYSKIPVPTIQYQGSSIDADGNLHIHRIDNATGNELPDLVRNYNQAYSDFDKIYGDNYAPQMGSATGTYAQKNFKKATPSLQELRAHFSVPNVVTNKYNPANDPPVYQDPLSPTVLNNQFQPPANIAPTTPANSGVGLPADKYQDFLRKNGLIK